MNGPATEPTLIRRRSATALGWVLPSIEGICSAVLIGWVLTAQNLFEIGIDDRFSGVSAPAIHRFLATDYRSEVLRAAVELFALSTLVGATVGLGAALLWWGRERWLGRADKAWIERLPQLLALIGCGFAWMYLYDLASRPALHQAGWFERGGVRAWVQIVVADGLGKTGIWTIGGLSLTSFLLWPLRGRGDARRLLVQLMVSVAAAVALLQVSDWWFERGHGSQPNRAADRPNILVIAADSLRPDRLDERRAPNIARLMQRATTFERTYTPLARTFPAWVSMVTGQYPQRHGIRHMFPRWEIRQQDFDTVGKRLGQSGYHTAVVGDFAADIFRRIDLGFQRVHTPTFTMRELVREHLLKNDPWLLAWVHGRLMRWLVPVVVEMHEATDPIAVSREAIRSIDEAEGKPFFVTVFYSTPHFPYATPGPHHRRFAMPGYAGPYRYAKADTLDATEVVSEADAVQIRALYDGAVYATDQAAGVLLADLEERGLLEHTIVVVTADHGEQLYEYGRSQGHGDHLQGDEALRVPLVIADPAKPVARRVAQPVSLTDLGPTLLDMVHVGPLGAADGHSLVPAIDGQSLEPVPIYSETGLWFTELIAEVPLNRRIPYPDLTQLTEVDRKHSDQIVIREKWEPLAIAAKHRMLQLGDRRLLYVPTRAGPEFELYDLKQDPGCTNDVSKGLAAEFEQLKTRFWQFAATDPQVLRQGDVLVPRNDVGAQGAGGAH